MLKWLKKGWGIILILIISVIGALIYQYENDKISVKRDQFRFEYGSEIPYTSDAYFNYSDRYETVTFDKALFAMKDIGSYEVKVSFAQKEYTLLLEIVDESAPIIQFNEDQATIYRYQNQLYGDFYSVTDNSTVEHEMQLKEQAEGASEICVTAIDAYQNKATECKVMQAEVKDLHLVSIPKVNSVEELVNAFLTEKRLNKNSFAFFYESFDDQESYLYNSDRLINAASTIKVPLNMLYEDAYAKQKMRPDQTISLRQSDIEAGGGYTSQNRLNTPLTYAYLQEQSIVFSDNTATNMLVRALGGFSVFRKQLAQYSDAKLPQAFYSQNVITAEYMADVMRTLYQGRDRYENLTVHMKSASKDEYLQASTDVFEVAQKYGSFEEVLHTVGIVYTPKPYIVGIFTMNREDGATIIKELNEWLIAYQLQK